jgi:hypothetical protein
MYLQVMGGVEIQAGDKTFIEPYSDRPETRRRSASRDRRGYRLIESAGIGASDDSFRLGKLAY